MGYDGALARCVGIMCLVFSGYEDTLGPKRVFLSSDIMFVSVMIIHRVVRNSKASVTENSTLSFALTSRLRSDRLSGHCFAPPYRKSRHQEKSRAYR